VSLTGPDYFEPERGAIMSGAAGKTCFFCEKKIRRDPACMWHGPTGSIYFHLGCAVDFAIRIFSDLHRWQQRTGERFGEAGK
jgi:hypothetical protein